LGLKYNAPVNLRFDTNPAKEEQEYVDAIKKIYNGWVFNGQEEHASDYFSNCMMGC
jgi:glutaminyl-tRNA synthetase